MCWWALTSPDYSLALINSCHLDDHSSLKHLIALRRHQAEACHRIAAVPHFCPLLRAPSAPALQPRVFGPAPSLQELDNMGVKHAHLRPGPRVQRPSHPMRLVDILAIYSS